MKKLLYDEGSIESIVEYAQRLENKSVNQVNSEQHSYAGVEQDASEVIVDESKSNKGKFGNFI